MFRRARLLCLLLCFQTAFAGDPPVSRPGVLHVTHETAMQMALARNFSIEVERFEPLIARENVRRAQGLFDPALEIRWLHTEDVFKNSLALQRRNTAGDDFSAGLVGQTTFGLRYDLGLGTNPVGTAGDEFRTRSATSITLPLLRDFGTDVNLHLVRIARNNAFASEWALRQRIIDVLTRTDFVYNELHAAHQALRAAERSRDYATQTLVDNEKRLAIGVKSPLDVTEARAEAAAREEAVILARRTVQDNENLLKQLVTDDLEAMLSVKVEIEPPPSPAFRPDVPSGIREALDLRPDYRQAVLELQNRNINIIYTRNQTLPRFDLVGSLALLGFDTDSAGSLSRTFRRDQTEWTVGAILSIPIGNRTARGAANIAKFEAAQQLVQLELLEQQIVVDVDNASGQVITSRERIASTAEARELALESLNAGEERLKAGVATTFVVLELQKKLADAESAEIRARADYNKAVSEYFRKTGTSLRVYHVTLRGGG